MYRVCCVNTPQGGVVKTICALVCQATSFSKLYLHTSIVSQIEIREFIQKIQKIKI
jgi:hypothetical protein